MVTDAIDAAYWLPMFSAFRASFDRVLDAAKHVARDYPAEVATVERVRTFMNRQLHGAPAHVRMDDVMFTLALIVAAIDQESR